MVYVGHGYVVKKKDVDAYGGADVKGKILVAHAGYPEGVTRLDLRGDRGPTPGRARPATPPVTARSASSSCPTTPPWPAGAPAARTPSRRADR